MTTYVGIDLGTTNSAICSYDGETLRLYKSPEQNDVTPSAIFFEKRGGKYYGHRAYMNAARSPDNAAVLFKRMMGTNTVVKLPAVGLELTPEQCSAEILKVLFGYLPDEVRNAPGTGTVITVPAAFNQMQKDATLSAAELAGIGEVALMQEPVAAVMAVMRHRKSDGIFVIYDFGGGTLDVAIAESTGGRVSLLSHGGIPMCGGRDFDLALFNEVAKPWLLKEFSLPGDFTEQSRFRALLRMGLWAVERAKIELSSKTESLITLSEVELGVRDESGNEIYLDVPVDRATLDRLISGKVEESIQATRETLTKAGLSSRDVERIAFVGGPTKYQPLRDRVTKELGIAGSTDVDPMTAVAEGAALFAESIDWSSASRGRKSARGTLATQSPLQVGLQYLARTPDTKAKVVLKVGKPVPGAEFQLDSLDTGWSSGRLAAKDGAAVDIPLGKQGDNTFKIFLFDARGGPLPLEQSKIVISRTAATVDAIPASSSLGFEVLDRAGGKPTLDLLVKEGEPLPKKGQKKFYAATSLRAHGEGALRFKLWEGNIEDRIEDNEYIGALTITGNSFEDGVIPAGAELVCDYEVTDSGNVRFEISIPSIQGSFPSKQSFYSRQAGQIDFANAGKRVQEDAGALRTQLEKLSARIEDPRLEQVENRLEDAETVGPTESDPERAKAAMGRVLEAKKLLATVRRDRRKETRKMELEDCEKFFEDLVKKLARPSEITSYESLLATARRAIDRTDNSEFETKLAELRGRHFEILWRQDWFVIDRFKLRCEESHLFPDQVQYKELINQGKQAVSADDIDRLRQILYVLNSLRVGPSLDDAMLAEANIVRQ
jgi:molecular chaperone DnaK